MDVGSTTVKAVLVEDGRSHVAGLPAPQDATGREGARIPRPHGSRGGLRPGATASFTGSGAGFLAPLAGGKLVQEVVAVAAAVEQLHPDVRFVSEIGGEDMKTIFFTADRRTAKSKQVFMQSACSGGTGTFVEKTARKLQIRASDWPTCLRGHKPPQGQQKCGIFAEADANTLVKAGVPVEEIIASLFEAVVCQNLATLTKGNTPMPRRAPAGRPEPVLRGAAEAWRHHLISSGPSERSRCRRAAIPIAHPRPRTRRSITRAGLRRGRPREAAGSAYQGREAPMVDRLRPARVEGQGRCARPRRQRGGAGALRRTIRDPRPRRGGLPRRRARARGRSSSVRLRQHHGKGRRADA